MGNRFLVLFFLYVLLFSGCTKEEMPQGNEEGYEQYGTPLAALPATEDIVMYEVNLRAFSAQGTIQGVTERIDHIQALGVNVIWLMPIHPIGEINSVNSPYSVKDYKAISPEYGTLEDLRSLTDAAHDRGIAVIMDWVANHTSWDHPWTTNENWHTRDANGNIIHPPGTNWLDVADLNYNNAAMRAAMVDAMKYWVYEANIDGFRCDYADGVPFDFWKSAWNTLNAIPGRDFILFAEGTRDDHFTAGFDLNFGWEFYGALKNVFDGQPVSRLFTAHENEYRNNPPGTHWIRFTTNHDESAWDATPVVLFNGKEGALAASVATIFTGGVPLLYGSQEVGASSNIPFFTNSAIRWDRNPEMLESYKRMMTFYNAFEVARSGQNTIFNHPDIACIKKTLGNEEIWVLINVRNRQVEFEVPDQLANTTWKDVETNTQVSVGEQLNFEPYRFYILH